MLNPRTFVFSGPPPDEPQQQQHSTASSSSRRRAGGQAVVHDQPTQPGSLHHHHAQQNDMKYQIMHHSREELCLLEQQHSRSSLDDSRILHQRRMDQTTVLNHSSTSSNANYLNDTSFGSNGFSSAGAGGNTFQQRQPIVYEQQVVGYVSRSSSVVGISPSTSGGGHYSANSSSSAFKPTVKSAFMSSQFSSGKSSNDLPTCLEIPKVLLNPVTKQRPYSLLQMVTVGYKTVTTNIRQKINYGASHSLHDGRRASMNASSSGSTIATDFPVGYFTDNDLEGSVLLPQHKHIRMWPLLFRRFKFVSLLGEGRFSKVVLCEDLFIPNRKVAIKVMNQKANEIGIQESLHYYKMQQLGSSKSISKLYLTFFFYGHFCLVFELLGENLLMYIQRFQSYTMPMTTLKKLAVQLMTGLAFMRDHNIIHADLKPENILMGNESKNSLRISDFGNALDFCDQQLIESNKGHQIQTLLYRAPEILLGLNSFDFQIDVWSVGCILIECYTGNPAFNCSSPEELFRQMVSLLGPVPYSSSNLLKQHFDLSNTQTYNFAKKQHKICKYLRLKKNNDFASFLVGLLEYDPTKRMTPLQALSHPFLQSLFPFSSIVNSLTQHVISSLKYNELKQENEQHKQTIDQLLSQIQELKQMSRKRHENPSSSADVSPLVQHGHGQTVMATTGANHHSFHNHQQSPRTPSSAITARHASSFNSPITTMSSNTASSATPSTTATVGIVPSTTMLTRSNSLSSTSHTEPPSKKTKTESTTQSMGTSVSNNSAFATAVQHNKTNHVIQAPPKSTRLSCEKCDSTFCEFSEHSNSQYVVKCKKCKHIFIRNKK
ncbi:hypothetical protein C9374_008574 [Naegleria lovaniensis]|uniref:Protein kinase domain-containing protein n=1 Tax=Naegleria lovaniensis TaxID=51637 RepID=A0AA88KF15_NAELO|nr:uncharacterized protein C9374_008574 [Naegleria lovaniensis]KAG2377952.1 hypothetical protein C9374_008574 [Naegleria lovaniensis]